MSHRQEYLRIYLLMLTGQRPLAKLLVLDSQLCDFMGGPHVVQWPPRVGIIDGLSS